MTRSGKLSDIQPSDPSTWQEKLFLTIDTDWATWLVTHDTPMRARLRAKPNCRRQGHDISCINIPRLINACNRPYVGAFCEFEGRCLRVWDAELVEDNEVFLAVPGQVVAVGDGPVEIADGDGKRLEVQIDNEIVHPAELGPCV